MRVLYLIVLAEMVRFLFLHGPGKKRVCSHSFIYLFNEHLYGMLDLFLPKYSIEDNIQYNGGFYSPLFFSLYYRCLSPGITRLFGLPC